VRQPALEPVATSLQAEDPLIIQYTNLLHQYRDPGASEVVDFVNVHRDDAVFVRRVEVLNRVLGLKEDSNRTES
jgi:hypothetical protein